jgi:hypothetical protein
VRPADLVGAIANEAGIPSHSIGEITLFDKFSFVDVPEASARHVEAALNSTSIRGHAPRATLARPQSRPDRSTRSGPPHAERGRPRTDHEPNQSSQSPRIGANATGWPSSATT